MRLRWSSGSSALQSALEHWFANPEEHSCEVLSESSYRRVVKLAVDRKPNVVAVKEFFPVTARRTFSKRAIAAVQHLAQRGPAQREWKALNALHAAGVSVPKPLGFAQTSMGGAYLVSEFIEGAVSLNGALDDYAFKRRRILRRVGELVHQFHNAGFAHGDLHVGNITIGDAGPVLVDLQRVHSIEHEGDRVRDIAFLDFSLAHMGVTLHDRLRFRIAALGLGLFRVAPERELLREIGRASAARALDYYRGRTRHMVRPGPDVAALRCGEQAGLRSKEFSEASVNAAIELHRKQVQTGGDGLLKCDHRSHVSAVEPDGHRVVVKEVVKTTLRKRLADVFRGSPARRAWVAGHGLRIRGIGAAKPLAFLETRRRGVPVASVVILEDLSASRCVADIPADDPAAPQLARQLLQLVLRMHRTHTSHQDFQTSHMYWIDEKDGPRIGDTSPLALIDLEGVQFHEQLHDQHRISMLSELNATLSDDFLLPHPRRELLEQYLRALPFERGNERSVREIVRRSVARAQAWKGKDCDFSPASS